ncbi:hypothetical protein MTO96_011046 [Rhipicephalus appendiculatus]
MFVRGAFLERCVQTSASGLRRRPDCHRDRQTLAMCPVFPHSLHWTARNRHRRRSCGPPQLVQEPLESLDAPLLIGACTKSENVFTGALIAVITCCTVVHWLDAQ